MLDISLKLNSTAFEEYIRIIDVAHGEICVIQLKIQNSDKCM